MQNLLNVRYDSDRITISARELHDFLEVRDPYRNWFPRMCEYGFTEGGDFRTFLCETSNGRPKQDAQITIEMAKELCMLQRSEKGKQARQYFIQLEKDWNAPEKVMARALRIAERELEAHKEQVKTLTEENEAMKPKALFADAVTTSKCSVLIGDLAKILRQNGYETGQNRLFEKLRNEGYLVKGKKRSDRNMPTQYSMELGLFEIKETTITHSDGHITINKTAKVTGKGQVYFVNKFLAEGKGEEKK